MPVRTMLVLAAAFAAFAAACAASSAALAKEQKVKAASGVEVLAVRTGSHLHKCRLAPAPKATVLQAPAHGTLAMRPLHYIADSGAPVGDHRCVKKPILGTAVYYRSAPGFHGTDFVRLRFTYVVDSGPSTGDYALTIKVK
jgi:hypothetical protein